MVEYTETLSESRLGEMPFITERVKTRNLEKESQQRKEQKHYELQFQM